MKVQLFGKTHKKKNILMTGDKMKVVFAKGRLKRKYTGPGPGAELLPREETAAGVSLAIKIK